MVRILMHGCCGRMGRMITELAAKDETLCIAAGVDAKGRPMPAIRYILHWKRCGRRSTL